VCIFFGWFDGLADLILSELSGNDFPEAVDEIWEEILYR